MKNQVTGKHGVNNFDPRQMFYLTGDINYSRAHLAAGQIIVSCRNLKWFADLWPNFVRVHKGTLINPAHIHKLKLASSARKRSFVIMCDAAHLAISSRQLPSLLAQVRQTTPTWTFLKQDNSQ